jgi:hypothetical protein
LVAGQHVFYGVEPGQVSVIDVIDLTRDQAIALKETGVASHVDQAAGHLGCADKTGALHLSLEPKPGQERAVNEKSVHR